MKIKEICFSKEISHLSYLFSKESKYLQATIANFQSSELE